MQPTGVFVKISIQCRGSIKISMQLKRFLIFILLHQIVGAIEISMQPIGLFTEISMQYSGFIEI